MNAEARKIFKEICELEKQIGRQTPITEEQKELRRKSDALREQYRKLMEC